MPAHKHGMNYLPTVTVRRQEAAFAARGLLLHMPGRWEFAFDVSSGDGTRETASLDCRSEVTHRQSCGYAIVRCSVLLLRRAACVGSGSRWRRRRCLTRGIQRVLSFGPWPPAATKDPGNRVSGNAAAIELGRRLFFDARLSRVGYIACVTCHQPDRAWGDGKARAHGLADVDRNTPMLANLRLARWYGWSGASDSLWMASLRPILDRARTRFHTGAHSSALCARSGAGVLVPACVRPPRGRHPGR